MVKNYDMLMDEVIEVLGLVEQQLSESGSDPALLEIVTNKLDEVMAYGQDVYESGIKNT